MSEFQFNIHQLPTDEIVRFRAAMPDGSARAFTLRRLTAGPLAAARRVEGMYRRANDVPLFTVDEEGKQQPSIIKISDLVFFIMSDAGLTDWFLTEVYEGDHVGITWSEQEGVVVEVMLELFFVRNFASASSSSSAFKTSSMPSVTNSTPAPKAVSRRRASTSGITKKPPRQSRSRRKSSTG